MGTNYYWQPACEVCGCTHERPPREHIGKSSAGWVFSFHATDDVRSAKDWARALASGGTIVDEYGRPLAAEDFWRMVEQQRGATHNHARNFPRDSFLDDEGNSFSNGEFS